MQPQSSMGSDGLRFCCCFCFSALLTAAASARFLALPSRSITCGTGAPVRCTVIVRPSNADVLPRNSAACSALDLAHCLPLRTLLPALISITCAPSQQTPSHARSNWKFLRTSSIMRAPELESNVTPRLPVGSLITLAPCPYTTCRPLAVWTGAPCVAAAAASGVPCTGAGGAGATLPPEAFSLFARSFSSFFLLSLSFRARRSSSLS
mmetsp:Transcript_89622/g.256034  ORF Transcript_89622/g.256034 Transcript_89622/m.256034 type:complete len:208 (-) Transcript_89622:967-1590(-)